MLQTKKNQGPLEKGLTVETPGEYLGTWVQSFLVDRKAQGMSPGTLHFYRTKLRLFTDFAGTRSITQVTQVTPQDLRLYLLHLEERGHNPGGVHGAYRALKTFLKWWEDETEPEGWKNPVTKVKAPRLPDEPLDPVDPADVTKLVGTCDRGTFYGTRDRAIFLTLLDTGIRASELTALDLGDVDLVEGSVLVRQGKGRKPRVVFLGKVSRKAVRSWVKHRGTHPGALFVTQAGDRLTYWGLREMVRRHAVQAGIPEPGLHDFRRAFCLSQVNRGVPETTIARLLGHTTTQLIARYAKQSKRDLRESYRSPVDEL